MIRRDAIAEYIRGSLWVLPTMCVLVALILGSVLSLIDVGADSPLAFQGTADDARSALIGITSTMVTVIALLLGLAVVALQLSSTQFSPRLLRNFLRDRPNQIVLGVFVGTFAYSAAGLFTVGVSGGERTSDYPRFAVSVAIALMFLSLALLVFFADHLAHSIQVDSIMRAVERNTLGSIRELAEIREQEPPEVPEHAIAVQARYSGYVQTVDTRRLLAEAVHHRLVVHLRPRVGEHVAARSVLAWVWPDADSGVVPGPQALEEMLDRAVRQGYERTLEQDPGLGFRQLVDIACKALSPAVNDPYTAIQAVEHLTVLFAALGRRPVGYLVAADGGGTVRLVVPGRTFAEHLALGVGLIRRYGAKEPTVVQALLRLLGTCGTLVGDDPERLAAIERQAEILVADAEREVPQPADLAVVYAETEALRRALAARRAGLEPTAEHAEQVTTPPPPT
jgi:uncharacterized membrane protein